MRYTSELITVTYSGDLATLYYHAHSLEKFWQGEKNWTIVVEDQDIYQRVIDWINDHIKPNMPGWKLNVKTGPKLVAVDGWHRQQILKLWAASESQADYSVVLDSKNFLIRNLSLGDFFVGDNLKVGIFDKNHAPSQDQIGSAQILGIDVNSVSEQFPITPFIWRNTLVRSLLDHLSSLNYDILTRPVLNSSEASLYWIFAQSRENWVESKDKWGFGQYGGFNIAERLTPAQLKNELDKAVAENGFMVTVHRFHITPESAEVLGEFLKGLNVIGDWKKEFFSQTFKNSLYQLRPEVIEILHSNWEMLPLKSITRNSRTIKFNRVVAYGCSHTAGSELADHLFWPTPATREEVDRIKRQYASRGATDFYTDYPFLGDKTVLDTQAKLSWAGQVAQKLGVPILNRGIAGSGMQGMIYAIEQDLSSGVLTEYDLILVGATSMERWMYFDKQERFGWPWPATPIVGFPRYWPSERFHNEFVEQIADEYFLFFNYYTSLRYLDLLSQELGGRLLVQYLHCTMDDYASFVQDKKLNTRFMCMATNTRRLRSIIDHDMCLSNLIDWRNDSQVHGFYHAHVEYHEKLANTIIDKLLNNE